MLQSLYINNFALIEELTINFKSGFNVLTGETGAGKSILIGALGLLLGERSNQESIRTGCEKAIIEGKFTIEHNEPAHSVLIKHEYANGEELIIRRELTLKGTSRAFINDSPVPLNILKELGVNLVDLHGQHDHQMLLDNETHIDMLDNAGGLEKILFDYKTSYQKLNFKLKELSTILNREVQLREKQDLYRYHLDQINEVSPDPNEDEIIKQELLILENSERIVSSINSINYSLYEDENSARDRILRARNILDQLLIIDPVFQEQRDEIVNSVAIIDEIMKFLQSYSSKIDYSSERLENRRERLLQINSLRKRFGGSLESVLAYKNKVESEIELSNNFDLEIVKIKNEIFSLKKIAGEFALRLSQKRKETARKIEKSIEKTLSQLGIEKSKFIVDILLINNSESTVLSDNIEFKANEKGIDNIEFFISTNKGEEPKPLVKVASGGEISRVMLALKTILAKNNKLPLLVFDEIDTGISGRIASKVGNAMKNLADFHQIIAITHLAQIAAMGHHHYVVEKITKKERNITSVRILSDLEHITEVARIMSSDNITETSLKMAKELIDKQL